MHFEQKLNYVERPAKGHQRFFYKILYCLMKRLNQTESAAIRVQIFSVLPNDSLFQLILEVNPLIPYE